MNREISMKVLAITVMVLVVSAFHYTTQIEHGVLHDIYRRMYYIPIALGSVWFGLRGGILIPLIIVAIYSPHIAMAWVAESRELANRLMEIALYFACGLVTGYFSEKEKTLRMRYQKVAQDLEKSYAKLQIQTDELVQTEENLRDAERLATVGQLTADLTHEIRNPLGSIKGAADILHDEFPPDHPKAEFVAILRKESNHLNNVVEEFLQFSKHSQTDLEHGSTKMKELVDDFSSQEKTRKSIVQFKVGNSIPADTLIFGSSTQIKQVLTNLVNNARQAAGVNGTVSIVAQVKSGKVKGPEFRDVEGKLVEIVVEDNGPGIPGELLSDIFKPFYTTKADGTGLGLAISQRIAKALGGNLVANNRPGGGARFVLRLPVGGDGNG